MNVSSRKGGWNQTATLYGTNDPEWNETFVFYCSRDDLLHDTATAAEYQKIIDQNPLFNCNVQSQVRHGKFIKWREGNLKRGGVDDDDDDNNNDVGQKPKVKIQIFSRPGFIDPESSIRLAAAEEAEISEDCDTASNAESDAPYEHNYSQNHRFLGRGEVDLTRLLDRVLKDLCEELANLIVGSCCYYYNLTLC